MVIDEAEAVVAAGRAGGFGLVTGVAVPVHRGRAVATYEVVITDDVGERICTARITCLLRGA